MYLIINIFKGNSHVYVKKMQLINNNKKNKVRNIFSFHIEQISSMTYGTCLFKKNRTAIRNN